MPSNATRSLYLQVGGDVSNLKVAMKDGRSALLDLVRAADETQGEIQQAMRGIAADPAALKQLVASYDQTFATIRSRAQAAMSANDNHSALNIINASGADQQAAAAAAQAAQLRIAADAAAAVAERQGEAGVAARVLAAALEVQAVDAAKVAAAMRGQADVLAEVAAEAKLAGAAENEVTGAHTRMGASGMIAEHVIRAMSDSIAAGQSPVRALTMEMGRITEALTMFAAQTNATEGVVGKFAAFMGGPWGLAVSVAVAVLVPLISELFEAEKAAEAAKLGNDGLSDAQGALGKMFDLTSGKLEKQNSLLRLNAQLTAVNLRAEAAKERASSGKALGEAGTPTFGGRVLGIGQATLGTLINNPGFAFSGAMNAVGNPAVAALAARARVANRLTNDDERGRALGAVLASSENTDFGHSSVSKESFQQAIIDAVSAPVKDRVAAAIDKSLNSGTLDQSLRNDPKTPRTRKPPKPKIDHSAEREANADRAYQGELSTAEQRLARANLALSDTAENRLKVALDELDTAAKRRDEEIGDQVDARKITEAEAQKLYDLNAETLEQEKALATQKAHQDILDRQLTVDQRILDRKLALLQLQAAGLVGSRAQRSNAMDQLAAEEEKQRNEGKRLLGSDKPEDRERGQSLLDQVDEQHAGRVAAVKREHQGPMQRYGQQLRESAGDMNDALKSVETDGLKNLEDGLVGLISGTESASQAFKKMADAIISDLLRIGIEKAIIGIFGFSSGGVGIGGQFADGFIPGFADGIIRGPGSGTSDSIPGWMDGVGAIRVSNGESIITAKATRDNAPWLRAMNKGLKLPAFADGMIGDDGVSIPTSYPSLPKPADLRGVQHQVDVRTSLEIEPSPMFDVRSRTIAQQTVGAASQPIMSGATNQTMKKLRRQALPGGYA